MGKTKPSLGNDDWSRIVNIYDHAVGLGVDERARYLQQATSDRPELRSVVDGLLDRATKVEHFMEAPVEMDRLAEVPLSSFIPPLIPGEHIGDFEIVARIGQGAMAQVYLANQKSLGRQVALKVSCSEGEEGKTIAQLDHEHVIKVFSQSSERGLHLIAMQYVPGLDLEQLRPKLRAETSPITGGTLLRLARAHAPPETEEPPTAEAAQLETLDYTGAILWIGACIAEAVECAHRKGILHSDIKPSNILLHRSGKPFISDFNVALSSQALQSGKAAQVGGTLHYMAPEHLNLFALPPEQRLAQLSRLDERIDIYSLGRVLQELFADSPTPLSENIQLILDKATSAAPKDRFATAAELAESLRGALDWHSIEKALPPRTPAADDRWLAACRNVWLIPQGIALAIAVLGTQSLFRGERGSEVGLVAAITWLLTAAWAFRMWTRRIRSCEDRRRKERRCLPSATAMETLRIRCLALPRAALATMAFPWIASYLASVHGISFNGSFSSELLLSLALHFLGVGLAAASIGALFVWGILLRHLYPRLWLGCSRIRGSALEELRNLNLRLLPAGSLAVGIPVLFGAIYWENARSPVDASNIDFTSRKAVLVGKLHTDILHRAPEREERRLLQDQYERLPIKVDPYSCVTYRFLQSDEAFRARVAEWHQTYLKRPESVHRFIENPDVTSPWAGRLAEGERATSVLGAFLVAHAQEIAALWGNGDYRSGLLAAVIQYPQARPKLRALASGREDDTEAFTRGVLGSEEYAVSQVSRWYSQYLRRPLQDVERETFFGKFWSDELALHQDEPSVLAGLLSSEEYTGLPVGGLGAFPSREICGRGRLLSGLSRSAAPLPLWASLALAGACALAALVQLLVSQHLASRVYLAFARSRNQSNS